MSTNKSKVKGKKPANTAAKRAADAAHEKWLKERGLHPSQRNLQQAFKGKARIEVPNLKVEENVPLSNKIDGNGLAKGIMVNLHKEKPEVQQAILEKANRVDLAYNKGPMMLMSEKEDRTKLGSRSRR